MQFEYLYVNQKGMDVAEFMEFVNEFGEEGYHLVYQNTFSIFLMERQVFPEMVSFSSSSEVKTVRPIIPDHIVFMLLMSVLTLIFVLAVVARVFHWV